MRQASPKCEPEVFEESYEIFNDNFAGEHKYFSIAFQTRENYVNHNC